MSSSRTEVWRTSNGDFWHIPDSFRRQLTSRLSRARRTYRQPPRPVKPMAPTPRPYRHPPAHPCRKPRQRRERQCERGHPGHRESGQQKTRAAGGVSAGCTGEMFTFYPFPAPLSRGGRRIAGAAALRRLRPRRPPLQRAPTGGPVSRGARRSSSVCGTIHCNAPPRAAKTGQIARRTGPFSGPAPRRRPGGRSPCMGLVSPLICRNPPPPRPPALNRCQVDVCPAMTHIHWELAAPAESRGDIAR